MSHKCGQSYLRKRGLRATCIASRNANKAAHRCFMAEQARDAALLQSRGYGQGRGRKRNVLARGRRARRRVIAGLLRVGRDRSDGYQHITKAGPAALGFYGGE